MPKSSTKNKKSRKKKNPHQKGKPLADSPQSPTPLWADSVTNRDTRLFENATSDASDTLFEELEQIKTYKDTHKTMNIPELLQHLAKNGVKLDESSFKQMAQQTPSERALASKWTLTKASNLAEVTALTSLLWDKLCPNLFRFDELDAIMARGYQHFNPFGANKGDEEGAVQTWMPAWHQLKGYAAAHGYKDIKKFDEDTRPYLGEFVTNWLQDIEIALGNIAGDSSGTAQQAAEQRLNFVREVCGTFPDTKDDLLFNFRRAEGESLFMLERLNEGDTCYEQLIADYPDDAWSYIGWGDEYSPVFWKNRGIVNLAKAKTIYERGLKHAKSELDAIEERLELLAQEPSES